MNKSLLWILAGAALIGGVVLWTSPSDERAAHYEKQTLTDLIQAQSQFTDLMGQLATQMQAAKKTETRLEALEAVHEYSYGLEAVADYLAAENLGTEQFREDFDEAVQGLHYASEKQNLADSRRWFGTLQSHTQAVAALQATATSQAAPDEATPSQTDRLTYTLVIKDHRFTPDELTVPANRKLRLIVDNQDPTPEEFESDDFRREKIIAGNSKASILVGPLQPGRYHFFGEFNLDTANGYLIVE